MFAHVRFVHSFARCSALAKQNLFFSPETIAVATATCFYKQSTGSGRLGIDRYGLITVTGRILRL